MYKSLTDGRAAKYLPSLNGTKVELVSYIDNQLLD